jgi:hypothetical protein
MTTRYPASWGDWMDLDTYWPEIAGTVDWCLIVVGAYISATGNWFVESIPTMEHISQLIISILTIALLSLRIHYMMRRDKSTQDEEE